MEKRDGEYIAYLRNGQIKEQCQYRDGKLVGPFLTLDTQEERKSAEGGFASLEEEEDFEEKKVENLLSELAKFTEGEKTDVKK
jgi:hypothetical protein